MTQTNLDLISVYVNPEFISFEEVETFRPYWPFNDEFISMMVMLINDLNLKSQMKNFF